MEEGVLDFPLKKELGQEDTVRERAKNRFERRSK